MTQLDEEEKKAKRDALIESNLGLVHACANKLRGKSVEYEDLFQAGCLGLIKAAEGFDESRGFAFSTYAVPVILGEIKRIFRDGGSLKVGRTLKEKARQAMKTREEMTKELGREPTVSELSEKLGVDIHKTAEYITVSMPTLSLTSGDDRDNAQLDIPTEPYEDTINEKMALHTLIASLEYKERRLIELRYFEGLTQVKVASSLGMSQVQVSRKEKAILMKLRRELK